MMSSYIRYFLVLYRRQIETEDLIFGGFTRVGKENLVSTNNT